MYSQPSFDALWNRIEDLELPPQQQDVCVFAKKFSEWATELFAKVAANPDIVSVNQAKLLLTDKYFEWRNAVPRTHRYRIGRGHVCIFHVFEQTYERLKVVELALTPPMLFLPNPPLPPPPTQEPPPPQIAGIFIGELE